MKIKINFKSDITRILLISFLMSVVSSTTTYFLVKRQIPRFATVDLVSLNNDFIIGLSRFKMSKGAGEAEITQMVKNYSDNIEPLLEEISRSGNVILFQRQAIVTKTDDITNQVAEAIFKNPQINPKKQ